METVFAKRYKINRRGTENLTKLIPKLRNKTYEQRLKALNLITMEKRHLRQDMITLYNITQGKIKIEVTDNIEFIEETNTRGNKKKIRPKHTRLNIRKYSYFCRIWKEWNKLPETVVKAHTLNTFKSELMKTRIFKGC